MADIYTNLLSILYMLESQMPPPSPEKIKGMHLVYKGQGGSFSFATGQWVETKKDPTGDYIKVTVGEHTLYGSGEDAVALEANSIEIAARLQYTLQYKSPLSEVLARSFNTRTYDKDNLPDIKMYLHTGKHILKFENKSWTLLDRLPAETEFMVTGSAMGARLYVDIKDLRFVSFKMNDIAGSINEAYNSVPVVFSQESGCRLVDSITAALTCNLYIKDHPNEKWYGYNGSSWVHVPHVAASIHEDMREAVSGYFTVYWTEGFSGNVDALVESFLEFYNGRR